MQQLDTVVKLSRIARIAHKKGTILFWLLELKRRSFKYHLILLLVCTVDH